MAYISIGSNVELVTALAVAGDCASPALITAQANNKDCNLIEKTLDDVSNVVENNNSEGSTLLQDINEGIEFVKKEIAKLNKAGLGEFRIPCLWNNKEAAEGFEFLLNGNCSSTSCMFSAFDATYDQGTQAVDAFSTVLEIADVLGMVEDTTFGSLPTLGIDEAVMEPMADVFTAILEKEPLACLPLVMQDVMVGSVALGRKPDPLPQSQSPVSTANGVTACNSFLDAFKARYTGKDYLTTSGGLLLKVKQNEILKSVADVIEVNSATVFHISFEKETLLGHGEIAQAIGTQLASINNTQEFDIIKEVMPDASTAVSSSDTDEMKKFTTGIFLDENKQQGNSDGSIRWNAVTNTSAPYIFNTTDSGLSVAVINYVDDSKVTVINTDYTVASDIPEVYAVYKSVPNDLVNSSFARFPDQMITRMFTMSDDDFVKLFNSLGDNAGSSLDLSSLTSDRAHMMSEGYTKNMATVRNQLVKIDPSLDNNTLFKANFQKMGAPSSTATTAVTSSSTTYTNSDTSEGINQADNSTLSQSIDKWLDEQVSRATSRVMLFKI